MQVLLGFTFTALAVQTGCALRVAVLSDHVGDLWSSSSNCSYSSQSLVSCNIDLYRAAAEVAAAEAAAATRLQSVARGRSGRIAAAELRPLNAAEEIEAMQSMVAAARAAEAGIRSSSRSTTTTTSR